MKIGITGGQGFLGSHFRFALKAYGYKHVKIADRHTFLSQKALVEFVSCVDVIVHFAGVNKGGESAVKSGNINLAETLVEALEISKSKAHLVYANSIHSLLKTAYGQGKYEAGRVFLDWSKRRSTAYLDVLIPHVFGEFGKPSYNSVVSTFCHQLASGKKPEVFGNASLELVHAQYLANRILKWVQEEACGQERLEGQIFTVKECLDMLEAMGQSYEKNIIPRLDSTIELDLFNTYRSYLFPKKYPMMLSLKTDQRGSLFEVIKSRNQGQVFISTSQPEVIRGEHFHLKKVERFVVLKGKAEIRLRRLLSDNIYSFSVTENDPCFIDIPTFYAHNIRNTGSTPLVTLFWADQFFDPLVPDTYYERVENVT